MQKESTKPPRLATPGAIARMMGVPVSRITYILNSREIRPRGIAGTIRVYGEPEIEVIRRALEEIEARREGVRDGH